MYNINQYRNNTELYNYVSYGTTYYEAGKFIWLVDYAFAGGDDVAFAIAKALP